MVNRLLVWAGGNSRLEGIANTNSLAAKMVHRYVAGPALEDGVAAAVHLNGQGIPGGPRPARRGCHRPHGCQ
jgi:hypothetical protein